MQDGSQAINALVEQEANKLKGEEQETPEQIAAKEAAAKNEGGGTPGNKDEGAGTTPTPNQLEDLLKETNFKSIDELKSFLSEKNKPAETPEQIKRREEVYNANLVAYAVENELLKNDDVVRLENIKKMSDEDLVFEKLSEDVKDEILDELGEDASDEDILKGIKDAFEKEYPLNSKSDKVRARAEAKLAKAAAEIRSPLESSFNTAKTRYDDEVSVRQEFPNYQKSMKEMTSGLIPNSINFFKDKDGDEDVVADIPITEDDKKALLEELNERVIKKPETFILHKNGKAKEIQEKLQSELEYLIWKKFGDTGKKEIAKVYLSRGIAKGSDTGAKNSFATNQAGIKTQGAEGAVDAKQQVLDSTSKT